MDAAFKQQKNSGHCPEINLQMNPIALYLYNYTLYQGGNFL